MSSKDRRKLSIGARSAREGQLKCHVDTVDVDTDGVGVDVVVIVTVVDLMVIKDEAMKKQKAEFG